LAQIGTSFCECAEIYYMPGVAVPCMLEYDLATENQS